MSPEQARPRPDLAFLTIRSARSAASSTPPAPVAPAPTPSAPTPTVSSSLDLDAPEPEPEAMTAPYASGPYAASAPATSAEPPRRGLPLLPGRRMPEAGRIVLTPDVPSVVLSRTASGIGTLTVEAAVPADAGDVHVGCAYQLTDDRSSFLNVDTGRPSAPAGALLPVLVGSRGRFARIGIDLRQVQELERVLVVLHSPSRTALNWSGTLLITTHAGDRVEVPLDPAEDGVALAAVSIYQVRGELTLRAELDSADSARSACAAFGYELISWLDDSSPIS